MRFPCVRRARPGMLLTAWMTLFSGLALCGSAAEVVAFDLRVASQASEWRAQHDIAGLDPTPAGLVVRISGSDPYFAGPVRDYPVGTLLWLNLRLKSDTGGGGQVFFHPANWGPTEANSVRFPVTAGDWQTVRIPCPAFGPNHRLRIDPPGDSGTCTLERVWFEERVLYPPPEWPVPVYPGIVDRDPDLRSGPLHLVHHYPEMGGFVVSVGGRRMAAGQTRGLIGYVSEAGPRWFPMPAAVTPVPANRGDGMAFLGEATDPDGATWRVRQQFALVPGRPGTIAVDTTLTVNRERSVLHWPALTLFVGTGEGGTGTNKQQALLAGVEYLDNEPSSSEADLEGPQARRQVADTLKLTFPLATVVADNRYVGLVWAMHRDVGVVFDSPDRIFRSGGHVLGLVVPGSDGLNREEGSLVPYEGRKLEPGQSIFVQAWIVGGAGSDVTPAIRDYVSLAGLPEVPSTGYDAAGYFSLAARGWLDSEIREGDLFRHAVVGPFGAGAAADAAYFMDFLADRVGDEALAGRLRALAPAVLGRAPTNTWHGSGVGHVRMPVAPLVYGAVADNAGAALRRGQAALSRFDTNGTIRYLRAGSGPDYARTHWTNEANGLTAEVVHSVLLDAAFSGDPALIEAGLRHLRALSKFHGGVPRGAQTWEVPLHTPDILASAHLVRAYTLGHQLSGDPTLLEEARHWAWTGVPFVYLRAPVSGPVGAYATTPVLGATQWVAPNWIGLPVQWCGLVYADALYRLADVDGAGPWRQLADGITASGVQQTYPASDSRYLGLLPDSFSLRPQQRNPANINPATLLACATRLFGAGPVFDSRRFGRHGAWVQAAGGIDGVSEDAEGFAFRVTGWPRGSHRVLIQGLRAPVEVLVDGRATSLASPHHYEPAQGRLMLEVTGKARIEVRRGEKR